MLLKLTEAEIEELRGKRFASSCSTSESSVTTIVDVRLRDGRQRVIHEYKGKLIKTPLSVFLLRYPWRVN